VCNIYNTMRESCTKRLEKKTISISINCRVTVTRAIVFQYEISG